MTLDKRPFDPQDTEVFELDKIPGWWTVTHWPTDHQGTVLRLRVQHSGAWDLNDFVCEVRFKPCEDFQELAKGELITDVVNHPECLELDKTEIYLSFPAGWRARFWAMARRISAILGFMELGETARERYAGEPATSRDFLECPEADSLIKERED